MKDLIITSILVIAGATSSGGTTLPAHASSSGAGDCAMAVDEVYWAVCHDCRFLGPDQDTYERARADASAHMRANPSHTCVVDHR